MYFKFRYAYVLTNWVRACCALTIISYYSQSKTSFVVISNSSVGHREMMISTILETFIPRNTPIHFIQHNDWQHERGQLSNPVIASTTLLSKTSAHPAVGAPHLTLDVHKREIKRSESPRSTMVNSRSTIHSLRAVDPSTKPGPAELLGNNKRHQNHRTPSLKISQEKLWKDVASSL